MAFEPIYEKSAFDCLKRVVSGQAVVEARLLPGGGAGIARILSVATNCTVTPGEVFAGEARYGGRVNFKVLYVDTEGTNHSLDYNADFTDKLLSDELKAGIKPIMQATVLDTDIIHVAEDEIKLACVAEVCLDAVMGEQMRCLVSGGESIYTHDDKLEYSKMSAVSDETFILTDVLENVKTNNVLLTETRAIITKRTAGIDCITLEGTVICDLCCEAEDGSIISYQMATSFTQEIAAVGAGSEDDIVAYATVNNCKISMEMDGDGNFSIAAEYTVCVFARTFSLCAFNPIVDAFCIKNELLTEGSSVKVCKNRCNETVADRVEGSITLENNMPMADNVLAITGARLHISNAIAGEGKVTFEGVTCCNTIYYSSETNAKYSVAVELPFSLTVNAFVELSDKVTALGQVTGVGAKIRRGNEIDIKADISIEYTSVSEDVKYVITELKLGEERALPTGAFAIHIARGGETLWDVAKALATTPELVLLQNPNLTLPLSGGERVLAYRHLKE